MKSYNGTIRQQAQIGRNDGGFTLVEVLVVVTIMAVLTGIVVVVIGNVLNQGNISSTRAALMKIDKLVEDRMRAFRIAKERGRFDDDVRTVSNGWSGGPSYKEELVRVCVHKHYLGKYFGMDVLLDPPASETATDADVRAFSSEILYELLTKGTIGGQNPVPQLSITAPETDFSSLETGDTDGDGKLEFVDGWGNPFRFYLWPTYLTRPDDVSDPDNHALVNGNLFLRLYIPAAADKPSSVLITDPDDPKGLLSQAEFSDLNNGTFYMSYLNSVGFNFNFDESAREPHHFNTFHAPVIVSAGRDQELGVKEFYDRNLDQTFILAEPIDGITATQTDATEPDHVYNSVMNDDLTNQQQTGSN